jgi:hypothetical protein
MSPAETVMLALTFLGNVWSSTAAAAAAAAAAVDDDDDNDDYYYDDDNDDDYDNKYLTKREYASTDSIYFFHYKELVAECFEYSDELPSCIHCTQFLAHIRK